MKMMNQMMAVMMDSFTPDEKQDTMLKMMPEMVKNIKMDDVMEVISGMVSEMMFVTKKSRFSFAETVTKVEQNGRDFGWYNPVVTDRHELEQNFSLPEPNKVTAVSMCIPRAGYEILKVNKKLATMMPLQVVIYQEGEDVYISWMNIKMMGKLFGSKVSEIMGNAAQDMEKVLSEIYEEEK